MNPDMSDVPIGEPRLDYRPGSIGQGLLDLAAWFDIYDNRSNYVGERAVQRDLRAWAARTMHMPADEDEDTVVLMGDNQSVIEKPIDKRKYCINCKRFKLSNIWWKCCPTHTPQNTDVVVCDTCYHILHSENPIKDILDEINDKESDKKDR